MTPIAEAIDRIPDEVLLRIIKNSNDFLWNFLALKIMLTRLNLEISMCEGGQSIIPKCCNELKNLLKKSANIPNSRNDLKQILGLIS